MACDHNVTTDSTETAPGTPPPTPREGPTGPAVRRDTRGLERGQDARRARAADRRRRASRLKLEYVRELPVRLRQVKLITDALERVAILMVEFRECYRGLLGGNPAKRQGVLKELHALGDRATAQTVALVDRWPASEQPEGDLLFIARLGPQLPSDRSFSEAGVGEPALAVTSPAVGRSAPVKDQDAREAKPPPLTQPAPQGGRVEKQRPTSDDSPASGPPPATPSGDPLSLGWRPFTGGGGDEF